MLPQGIPPKMSFLPSLTSPVSVLGLPLTSQVNLSDPQISFGVTTCSVPAQGLLWSRTELGQHQSWGNTRDGATPVITVGLAGSAAQTEPSAEPVLKPSQFKPHLPTDPARLTDSREPSHPEVWQTLSHEPGWQPPARGCALLRPPRQVGFVRGVCRMWLGDPSGREAAALPPLPQARQGREAESLLCAGEGVRYSPCRS